MRESEQPVRRIVADSRSKNRSPSLVVLRYSDYGLIWLSALESDYQYPRALSFSGKRLAHFLARFRTIQTRKH